MSTYMQMGHDTENLIGTKGLEFDGIILSPVNREPSELVLKTYKIYEENPEIDIILDSQIYYPRSTREKLNKYSFFPSDFETADHSSIYWWQKIIEKQLEFAPNVHASAVTSPAIVPRKFSDDYYKTCIDVGKELFKMSSNTNIRPLQTVVIDFDNIESEDEVMKIASIISGTPCDEIYLVFISNKVPRQEYSDDTQILKAMTLIRLLESSGKKTIVAFCSSDAFMFKAAGASSCATGKFFNLRRFTPSRFDDPNDGGGGQLPYWFEEGLMTFLRQADLIRIKNLDIDHLLQQGSSHNPFSSSILEQLSKTPQKPWVGLSWRQYLSWFSKAEKEFSNYSISDFKSQLLRTDKNWGDLDTNGVFLEERTNNGTWIRSWLQALSNFEKKFSY